MPLQSLYYNDMIKSLIFPLYKFKIPTAAILKVVKDTYKLTTLLGVMELRFVGMVMIIGYKKTYIMLKIGCFGS